jgi:hypothetical protein
MFEAAKGGGMDNPVPVALEITAGGRNRLRQQASAGAVRIAGIGSTPPIITETVEIIPLLPKFSICRQIRLSPTIKPLKSVYEQTIYHRTVIIGHDIARVVSRATQY